jgi:hypothetical protein
MSLPFSVVAAVEAAPAWEEPAVAAEFQSRARRERGEFDAVALDYLESAGATVVRGAHHRHAWPVDAEVVAANGARFLVLAHGNIGTTSRQPGLERPDTLAKVASRVVAMAWHHEPAVVVVTPHLPKPNSACARQLADLRSKSTSAQRSPRTSFRRIPVAASSQKAGKRRCPAAARRNAWSWDAVQGCVSTSGIDRSRGAWATTATFRETSPWRSA